MSEEKESDSLMRDIEQALTDNKDMSSGVEAIREMFDKRNIMMKSHVRSSKNESFSFTRLHILGESLGIPMLTRINEVELMHRVSNDRMGRQEAVRIGQQHPNETKKGGFFSRMFGGA